MRNVIIIKSRLHVRVAQIHVVGMRNFLVLRRRSHLRHMARAINLTHGSRTLRLRYAFWQFRDDSIRLRDALILSGKTIVNVL